MRPISFVILAAGAGVRMKSSLPKPLQKVGNKTMLEMVVTAAKEINFAKLIVVVSDSRVESKARELGGDIAWQEKQLGTADALKVALCKCKSDGDVIVACTDIPLVTGEIYKNLYEKHKREGNYVTMLTTEAPDPEGYGRVIKDGDRILRIVEEKEASGEEKKVRLINSGIYCIVRNELEKYLEKVKMSPVKGEYYLTSLIEIVSMEELKIGELNCEYKYVRGVNTKEHLKEVEGLWSK